MSKINYNKIILNKNLVAMTKTVIQKLISDLKKLKSNKIELTNKGMIVILKNSLLDEREQIIKAFDEGVKYGNSDLQTFDYPASRYYGFTYEKIK